MHLASDADFYLGFEAATADVSHVRDRRPHAQRSAALCLLAVCTRDEGDFSGAEFVRCAKLEDRGLLSAFSNMQRLRRAARDRQLLIGLRAQFDLGVRPEPSTLLATVTPVSNSSPGAASTGTLGVITKNPRIRVSRSPEATTSSAIATAMIFSVPSK